MRSLAYIETIKALKPIPEADKIECAEVLGWEVVCKKGEFQVGDKVIYCEIDSILPQLPLFEFLRSKKFRIKTIKLKNQISQGIVFPLSILTEINPNFDLSNLKVGDDLTETLQITKHDPEADLDVDPEPVKKSWLANKLSYYKWKMFGIKPVKHINGFPNDVPKTDEVRVQKMGSLLERREGNDVYISEKLEGASLSFIYRQQGNWFASLFNYDGLFQACSRNRVVYNSRKGCKPDHYIMTVEKKYNIHQGMKKLGRTLAIQGEVVGPKIQGNIYRFPEYAFYVFNVFDIDQQVMLSLTEMHDICEKLNLNTVPVLERSTLKNDIKYYVDLSSGKSRINGKVDREGIVVRGINNDFSFKSISPTYLLKQKFDE